MALSSGSKKSHQSDSDSDFEDEVVTRFPSCVRRMNGLSCWLIIVMICLER
jgi:hypothetical protein